MRLSEFTIGFERLHGPETGTRAQFRSDRGRAHAVQSSDAGKSKSEKSHKYEQANTSFGTILPTAQSIAFPECTGLDRRRLSRVLDYIEANLERDISLDSIASIACLSRCHFSRSFKQAVGHPPLRYVNARRLERATALLIEGDRSLVDIALTLGFSNQANFTRAFRQATGLPPGQYRRRFDSRQRHSLLADNQARVLSPGVTRPRRGRYYTQQRMTKARQYVGSHPGKLRIIPAPLGVSFTQQAQEVNQTGSRSSIRPR